MPMLANIMGAAEALQARGQQVRDYVNQAGAPPQGEDSWIVSMTETAGQIAGMSIAGITGACVGFGTHLASNYAKLDSKTVKAIESSGEMVGLFTTALVGVAVGIGIDHALNSQGAAIWALAICGLSHYLLSSYAKNVGKVLLSSSLRMKGMVFRPIAGSYRKALEWGTVGLEAGGKVGRVLGHIPSTIGSRKADELIGEEKNNIVDAASLPHFAAHFLIERVSGIALLALSTLAVDTWIMNLGLSEALLLSVGIQLLKSVTQLGANSVDQLGEETANRVKNLATAAFFVGVYGTGALDGGWTGSLIRGGVSTSSMALNLAWNNTSLIQQAVLFSARFICAIAIGYVSLVVESPMLILPSIVLGAVIARLCVGEKKDSAAPIQGAQAAASQPAVANPNP